MASNEAVESNDDQTRHPASGQEQVQPEDPRLARLRAMESRYSDPDTVAAPGQDEPGVDGEAPTEDQAQELAESPEQEESDIRLARLRRAQSEFVDEDSLKPQEDEELPFELDEEALKKSKPDIPVLLCTRCGTENDVDEAVCSNCGAKLPKLLRMESMEQYAPGSINGTLSRFEEAARKVRSQEWSDDDLYEFVENMYLKLNTLSQQYVAYANHTQYSDVSAQEVKYVIEGMDQFEDGVGIMALYLDDGEEEHLDHSLDVMREANDKIIEGLRLNREYRKSMADQLDFNV